MADRPTMQVRVAILDVFDDVWTQFTDRLVDLSPAEYLWEPVSGMWTVEPAGDGRGEVTGAGETDVVPIPPTTIAWRTWHLAVDCLDSYSSRALGSTGASLGGTEWHLHPDDAITDLDRARSCFLDGLAQRPDDEWWDTLGGHWGPFADHSYVDLALHALHEVTHHTAEIALLRDLYRMLPPAGQLDGA